MKLMKFATPGHPGPRAGLVSPAGGRGQESVQPFLPGTRLCDIFAAGTPAEAALAAIDPSAAPIPLGEIEPLAPIDDQEVWGAGVTYQRSKVARQEESKLGATFYDMVYRAPRPELFFKANPRRVSGPGRPIRIRADSEWSVPEPELALVISPGLRLVGFTLGNDVSARDIEGENPLYLPQAKVHDACCALGPAVVLAEPGLDPRSIAIRLTIRRGESVAFEGETSVDRMVRTPEELIGWLGRDQTFPEGAILLTGTGIVPPDEFRLEPGDLVSIAADPIGTLTNQVSRLAEPGR